MALALSQDGASGQAIKLLGDLSGLAGLALTANWFCPFFNFFQLTSGQAGSSFGAPPQDCHVCSGHTHSEPIEGTS